MYAVVSADHSYDDICNFENAGRNFSTRNGPVDELDARKPTIAINTILNNNTTNMYLVYNSETCRRMN